MEGPRHGPRPARHGSNHAAAGESIKAKNRAARMLPHAEENLERMAQALAHAQFHITDPSAARLITMALWYYELYQQWDKKHG